jgi:signal-transduction protein with cAMP-binding, CBS, and nucleotidyltransferase domain
MEQLLHFLNSICPLSPALQQHLFSILKEKELLKKGFLLKAGHVCRQICFVQKGLLRCFYIKGETEVCSWFMKETDVIISIESFFQQKESYEFIQALEDCTLYYIEHSELQHIYKYFPEFNFTGRVLTEKYYTLWAQQLYGLRMQQAPDRYKWLMKNHHELILRVPAKHLASWLGITEVMLSRIKSRR